MIDWFSVAFGSVREYFTYVDSHHLSKSNIFLIIVHTLLQAFNNQAKKNSYILCVTRHSYIPGYTLD